MPSRKNACPECGMPKKIEAATCKKCYVSRQVCPKDARKKISEAAKKRWANPEFKARLSGDGLSEETKKKHSEAMKRIWKNPEYRNKMSNVSIENWKNEAYRDGQVKRLKAYRHSEDSRKKIGDRHRGKTNSEESRKKNSISNKGRHRSPETEFTSELLKRRYRDPEYIKKIRAAWNIKPNKLEIRMLNLLNSLYPGEWKYTGDFSFTINGKCPDFVNCNGQKKLIEVFGDHWHEGHDPQDRINAFTPFGYKTLVIWQSEFKNIKRVIERIDAFMEKQA